MTVERAPWRPSLGAWLGAGGVRFRVWAPVATHVTVEIESDGATATYEAEQAPDGYHTLLVPGLGAGARYRHRLDGGEPLPDPASRYQPEGVHGPSEVIDPAYAWRDEHWTGLDRDAVVIYELHIGTFTPEGTFAAAAQMLPHIADLGATAIQLMPVADFAGQRNWGYDGVDLFAPSRAYGRPDELRALVDAAHAEGLGVILDVVYNHFGPAGAYHSRFSPQYLNEAHRTPWGPAINLDGPDSEHVRGFFFESGLHWLHEYHVDGFRLDATHALIDEGNPHFLAEYRDRTAEARRFGQPAPFLLAEDSRNLARIVQPRETGGYGFDAIYADDFHHEVHRMFTGASEGYYRDVRGTTEELATSLESGWLYSGQPSPSFGEPRGTSPEGVPLPRFMHCLQNHDQVGNRAFGDRLYHEGAQAQWRAATAVLLFGAATPTLFMGDEWTTSSPFLYFTDHEPNLGRLVVEGRRKEFEAWAAFSDPALREHIPDPQDPRTFERSRLDWARREREPYASMLRFTREWLWLRRDEPVLRWSESSRQHAAAIDASTIALRRECDGERPLLLVARLQGSGPLLDEPAALLAPPQGTRWQRVLTTEEPEFALDALPMDLDDAGTRLWCYFRRPGAVLLRAVPRNAEEEAA